MNKLMKNMRNIKKKKKGFTLVELVIVIAIIAILAAMALPKFGAARTDAKVSNDVAAAKNIQSTVARLVANGTIKEDPTGTLHDVDSSVSDLIDGTSTPTAKAGKFQYTVDKEGNVKVYSDQAKSVQLAPASDSTEKDYKAAVK